MPKIPIPEEKSVVLDKSVVSEKIDVRSKSIEPAKKAKLHDWNYNKSHREQKRIRDNNRGRKHVFNNQRRSYRSLSPQQRLEMEIENKIASMTKTCEKLEN
jgi:hypothetical protein